MAETGPPLDILLMEAGQSGASVLFNDAMQVINDAMAALVATTTFLGLTDTPNSYSGQGGNLVTVNSGATALDFTVLTAAGRALLDDANAAAQRTTLGLGPTDAVQHASLGLATPAGATGTLTIAPTTTHALVQHYAYNGNISYEQHTIARGLPGSLAMVQANDLLFDIRAQGYDGTSYQNAAIMRTMVDGTPAAGSMPGRFSVLTTPAGSNSPVERLRITNTGAVGIGTVTPAAALAVRSDGASVVALHLQNNNQATDRYTDILLSYGEAGAPTAPVRLRAINNTMVAGSSQFSVWTSDSGYVERERLRIDTGGNLGVGVGAPTAKLHVHDAATSAVSVRFTHATRPTSGFTFSLSTADVYFDNQEGGLFVLRHGVSTIETLKSAISGSTPQIAFLGAAVAARQTLNAAATDAATTQALCNQIRAALILFGLCA